MHSKSVDNGKVEHCSKFEMLGVFTVADLGIPDHVSARTV